VKHLKLTFQVVSKLNLFKTLVKNQESFYVTNKKRILRRKKRKMIKIQEFRKQFNENMDKLEKENQNLKQTETQTQTN
jgi:hypothetical protein